MKCDELKAFRALNIDEDETGMAYPKAAVDAAIAELKAKLESVQATAYTESVDAGMENRKLLRALWISRAKAYHYIAELITCFSPEFIRNRRMFTPNI